jgi:hypothetical protein
MVSSWLYRGIDRRLLLGVLNQPSIITRSIVKERSFYLRLAVGLSALLALAAGIACSDNGSSGGSGGSDSPSASQAELCKGLAVVRQDLDTVKQAAESGDTAKANNALDDARTHLAELRSETRNEPSSAVAQSAADLVGALDGLQTTLRQTGQGGGSVVGVIQQLEIQLASMASSLESLRGQTGCT